MNTSFSRAQYDADVKDFPYEEVCGVRGSASPAMVWAPNDGGVLREAAAHETGVREGEARANAKYEGELQAIRKSIAAEIAHFSTERKEYFRHVEQEVVQLAVNIARKILLREAHIDPLLLAGMVRVALGQIGTGTRVTVRVHPHQVSDFRMFFAAVEENPPEIVEDPALPPEQCVLQTELGKVEIGPEIQLKEIEAGLLDLQAVRPQHP